MPITRLLSCAFLFLFLNTGLKAQSVVINEIMSDNEDTILDFESDTPDWIELYNNGNELVNLEGYYLSDKEEELTKWKIPQVELEPGDYLLIFASDKNIQLSHNLHTNFKISANGESIYLSNPEGIIIDQLQAIMLGEDESYGRLPDGSETLVILPSQSPGESNSQRNKLEFSQSAGFYNQAIDLSITSILGDPIYYSTDGSEPTENSTLYQTPLLLIDKTDAPNVWSEIPTSPPPNLINNPAWESPGYLIPKANIIKCASFKNGSKTSDTYTQTYFVFEDIFGRFDMPVISLITEGKNFFDHDLGIYVPGAEYDPSNPVWTGNYFKTEIESERPIHIEFFNIKGQLQFAQNAGARIHGGKTRHAAQKSLRMYARTEYGEKYFNHQLMPQKEVTKYKRFILQTTMSSWGGDTVIKDILGHEIVRKLDIERMDYQPVVVFLNGEYWGIHHIRDRLDEDYLSYTTGLSLDSVEIDRVGNTHFKALKEYFLDNVPIDNEELAYISTQMDMNSYIDYQIAEMFLKNYDWPANNSKHWRPKTDNGKWRWMFYDLDGGFGDYDYNMFEHNTSNDSTISWPNNPRSTFFFRSLIENEIFQEQFLNRYKELLETEFKPSVTKDKLFNLIEQYTPEMTYHIQRWNSPLSINAWHNDIENNIIDFLQNRPCAVVENAIDFFDFDTWEVECKENLDNVSEVGLSSNLKIAPNPNSGHFSIVNDSENNRLISGQLINSIGQSVHRFNSTIIPKKEAYYIALDNLPSGLYFLKIQEGFYVKSYPIVINEN